MNIIHNWLKQNKKELIYTLVLAILLAIFAHSLPSKGSEKQEEVESLHKIVVLNEQTQEEYLDDNMKIYNIKVASLDFPIESEPIEEEIDFPYYDNIPLSEEVQQYIYETAAEYSISYELVLAIAEVESDFDPKAVSYNDSSLGLFQINKNNTLDWIASEADIENVDPFNPKHSARMAAWYVSWLRDYWLDAGMNEEDVTNAVLLSFNRGIYGAEKYMKKNGLNHSYVEKVLDYKYKLERGE